MPITWRSVTQPNQGSANSLVSQGIDTILGGFAGLSNVLRAPHKEDQRLKAAALDRALKEATINQGQQRIDNQVVQFDRQLTQREQQEADRAAALLTAADLKNARDNHRDATNRQHALDVLKIRQEGQTERARIEAESKSRPGKKSNKVNLLPFVDRVIKDNEDNIDDDSRRAITGLASFLQGEVADGNVTQAEAEAAILDSFRPGAGTFSLFGIGDDDEKLVDSLRGEFNNTGFQRFLDQRQVSNSQSALNQEQAARDQATQEESRKLSGFTP